MIMGQERGKLNVSSLVFEIKIFRRSSVSSERAFKDCTLRGNCICLIMLRSQLGHGIVVEKHL